MKLNDKRPERDTLCGTPNYISPYFNSLLKMKNKLREIINKTSYGFKSDCWAFGCIIYAMATGKTPFEVNNKIISLNL